jgi:hypothetical protein
MTIVTVTKRLERVVIKRIAEDLTIQEHGDADNANDLKQWLRARAAHEKGVKWILNRYSELIQENEK